ncbi:trypsin-1-like isoform X3 [Daphnia pulex]|uniref:trypsin-1-like isoform X3 n=1 Tax=Daphnia pulex TaxID=6669 RepID=UPI001EDE7BE5|nr:trypsin-1-like isoform X3 [Daphnia pulex]
MKIVILAALFACAMAMPKRMVLPRLPASVILSGKYQLIPEDKIVGGTVVAPNSLPFQVSLQRRSGTGSYSQSCGGSILDANVIIDAAHCVRNANVDVLRVVAGEHSLSQDSGLEQNRNVVSYTIHENYDAQTFENDIALIFMDAPLDLSVASAQPVNLPPPTSELDPPAGTVVTVSGWGTTSSGGSISDLLRSVDVPVVSDADCDAAYGGTAQRPAVLPSMLCAGDISDGGIDSCQGDSGGPLFTGSGSTAVQHGIVSWGQGCALAGYPGVYTQVSFFLDWISANRV